MTLYGRSVFVLSVLYASACGTIDTARLVNVRGAHLGEAALHGCELRIFDGRQSMLGARGLETGASFESIMVLSRPWPKPDETVKLEIDCNGGAEFGSKVVTARDLYEQREIEVVLTSKADNSN